uniref:Transmembrane protein n=1 Tax=Drosophila melanogaster TaxID=7227 RepID=M9NEW7_DROME|nr:uncharacterized protein Dmel_CG43136 [Drosophila melanogaster]AFH07252.1 uncharacterized protein Dmel_CG43136 [Drosophila melanogaster]|eukprot:NP_001245538.1 uncharacterized protein Dmel_CG43136 [Drosophila melanogaster]
MTNLICVSLAGLLHVIQFLAFYSRSANTPAPKLPSLFVGLAAMDIIWNNCFVPRALQNRTAVIRWIYELIVSYLLLEFVQMFWKPVDNICVVLMRLIILGTGIVSETNYENYESYWVGFLTVPLSLLILAIASQATDLFPVLRGYKMQNVVIVQLQWKGALRYINRNPTKRLRRIVPILREHRDQARRQRQQ